MRFCVKVIYEKVFPGTGGREGGMGPGREVQHQSETGQPWLSPAGELRGGGNAAAEVVVNPGGRSSGPLLGQAWVTAVPWDRGRYRSIGTFNSQWTKPFWQPGRQPWAKAHFLALGAKWHWDLPFLEIKGGPAGVRQRADSVCWGII